MRILKPTVLLLILLIYKTAAGQNQVLSMKVKAQTVSNLSKSLEKNYVYLDTAVKMGRYILHQLKSGSYDSVKTPQDFASRLTSDLLKVYHDGHLSIDYEPNTIKLSSSTNAEKEANRKLEFRRKVNFGFGKVEILDENIGYLTINGFFEPDYKSKTMALAAFRFISNSDNLVIDLRNNMGGDPSMVSFICGFFFNKKTHLNDIYSRKDKSLTSYWAIPDTILNALHSIPIYILTSNRTFSAGEEFAYDLQKQKRAKIVGEVTGGGAHPVQAFVLDNGFVANVPYARAINPITKSDWESIGVKPDNLTSADHALDTVLKMIKHN
jgi:hypothetical protein